MGISVENVKSMIQTARKVLNEDCKGITMPMEYAMYLGQTTSEAFWVVDLFIYVDRLAKSDGHRTNEEIREFCNVFLDGDSAKVNRYISLSSWCLEDVNKDGTPCILDELIKHDNARILKGEDRVAGSVWLFYVYYWSTVFVINADNYQHPDEIVFSRSVLDKIYKKICDQTYLPREKTEQIINGLLNYGL